MGHTLSDPAAPAPLSQILKHRLMRTEERRGKVVECEPAQVDRLGPVDRERASDLRCREYHDDRLHASPFA